MKKLFLTAALVFGVCVITNAQTTTDNSNGTTTIQSQSNTEKSDVVNEEVKTSGCGMKSSSAAGCCSSKKSTAEATAKSCCKSGDSNKSGCSDKAHHGNDESRKEKD